MGLSRRRKVSLAEIDTVAPPWTEKIGEITVVVAQSLHEAADRALPMTGRSLLDQDVTDQRKGVGSDRTQTGGDLVDTPAEAAGPMIIASGDAVGHVIARFTSSDSVRNFTMRDPLSQI